TPPPASPADWVRLQVSSHKLQFRRQLVPEMAHAGHEHGDAGCVGGVDDLPVADRAAGLDDGLYTGFCCGVDAVAEREEGIRSHDRTGYFELRVLRLESGDAGRVDTAHLSGTD